MAKKGLRRSGLVLILILVQASSGVSSEEPERTRSGCDLSVSWGIVGPGDPGALSPTERVEIEISGPDLVDRIVAPPGRSVDLRLATVPGHRLRIVHPSLWSSWREASAPDCSRSPSPLHLEARFAGSLSGSLVPEGPGASKNLEGPVTIDFRTAWAARAAAPVEQFEGTSDCRTELEGHTFACLLPEGRWDLAIRTPGYVATSIRDARVARGRGLDVGAHTVRRGGAVRGWVEKSDVDGGAAGVELRFDLRSVGHPTAALREEQESTAVRTVTDARGGFAVADLPPGSWVIEATAPGYAPALLTGVEVTPGQMLQMREPVRLTRPFDFEVAIDPPHDATGSAWNLRASRRSVRSGGLEEEPAFQGPVTGGIATIRVSIGDRLFLRVVDSADNGVWFDPDFAVDDEPDRRLDVVIEQVPVAGRVTVGDEPLQATLHFGGRNGAQRAECTSSSEGEFSVTLPRAGEWDVEVLAPGSSLETWTTTEVPKGGAEQLHIELPRTSVQGVVADSSGQTVAGAMVQLATLTSSVDARTNEVGEFELRSFAPGFVSLFARHEAADRVRRSKPLELTVADTEAVEGVRLILLENDETTGRIVGSRGPVAGADLFVKVVQPVDLFHAAVAARTELDGSFLLELPQGSRRAVVTVLAPGHPLTTFEIEVLSESVLELPGDAGELVVSLRSPESRHHAPVVYQDGVELPFFLLARWAQSHGAPNPRLDDSVRELRFPFLAPGSYRACWIDAELELERYVQEAAQTPRPVRCREGQLIAGARLDLALDSEGD